MIPTYMEAFLKQVLPERTWKNRLVREQGMCFMDFGPLDVDRLGRLGIEVDALGPKVVACLWDEESALQVGGYLVVDNLAMGRPSMGGIRMLPNITPSAIHNLARGMTLKNAAALLPYGGGKAGIIADSNQLSESHTEIVRRFARLLYRYRDIFLPGPDAGTNDADMKTIAIENGLDNALSKPAEMGGIHAGQLGAAGDGLIIALQALLDEIPRLQSLPQCSNLCLPEPGELTILVQGFGAVGSQAAINLGKRLPEARVVGISDSCGFLYSPDCLPVERLFELRKAHGGISRSYYQEVIACQPAEDVKVKFSNVPGDLLRESAFCLIPAAPIANYIDIDHGNDPSMTVEGMGKVKVIIEGANTYSPDPRKKTARRRMEREVYRKRGIVIAPDYLVNSGGVIFAAQETLIKTPGHLRIPDNLLGDLAGVDRWLEEHSHDLQELAAVRLAAAEKAREDVIRRNIRELVDVLISDPDMLPFEAAERISVNRIASKEKKRTARDIMESIITIRVDESVQQAARLLVETACPILAVITTENELAGVITPWDITKAASRGPIEQASLDQVMTKQVIYAKPTDNILELVKKLEYYEISAMPIVDGKNVIGMVSTDIMASRSLYRLLQNQAN